MATLAESFLADLEELSEDELDNGKDEEAAVVKNNEEVSETVIIVFHHLKHLQLTLRMHVPHTQTMQDGINIHLTSNLRLNDVANLSQSHRYKHIMEQVDAELLLADSTLPPLSKSESDPTYKLLVECNQLAVDIDNEIVVVYNFLRDRYRPKFPELESLIHAPVDYARVVQAIGNEMDVTTVDLDSLLPPATVMVVTVTATTTAGSPLDGEELAEVLNACELVLKLDKDKASILELVQRRMDRIAPNLSAAVGTEIAAQLMGVAGGLHSLASMPACNVQVLGAKRRNLAGFSSKAAQPHQGFIFSSDIIQQTPPALRSKAARLLGSKCTLLARIDAHGSDPSGAMGRDMRNEMMRKIEKWQEPPPAKKGDVLPVPDADELKKKRRGGRRYRKMKERYAVTELKKQANRMGFNKAEDEFIDGEETIGLGVIGKEGSGTLRAVAAQQRQKLSAKASKKYGIGNNRPGTMTSAGISTSGLSSSLAFTPIQGIELVNPLLQKQQAEKEKGGTESYFSEYSGFRSSKKLKP